MASLHLRRDGGLSAPAAMAAQNPCLIIEWRERLGARFQLSRTGALLAGADGIEPPTTGLSTGSMRGAISSALVPVSRWNASHASANRSCVAVTCATAPVDVISVSRGAEQVLDTRNGLPKTRRHR